MCPPSPRDLCVKGFITHCTIGRVETFRSMFRGRPFGHLECALEVSNGVLAPLHPLTLQPRGEQLQCHLSLAMVCCGFSTGPNGKVHQRLVLPKPTLSPGVLTVSGLAQTSVVITGRLTHFPCHPSSPQIYRLLICFVTVDCLHFLKVHINGIVLLNMYFFQHNHFEAVSFSTLFLVVSSKQAHQYLLSVHNGIHRTSGSVPPPNLHCPWCLSLVFSLWASAVLCGPPDPDPCMVCGGYSAADPLLLSSAQFLCHLCSLSPEIHCSVDPATAQLNFQINTEERLESLASCC